jgi:macrodomain Ter protein organizer (MatP/YcbG family)
VGRVDLEVICSDRQQHRQRLETRPGDISELRLPTSKKSLPGEYDPWNREHIVIDRRGMSMAEIVRELREASEKRQRNPGQI